MSAPPRSPVLSPTEALAVSRERLGQALIQARQGPASTSAFASGPGSGLASAFASVFASGTAPGGTQPPAALVAALVRRWWRRHPWRQAGTLAVQTADALARPVAQSHPAALMAGAAAVGALLVWSRPWRLLRGLRGAWAPWTASLLPNLLRDVLRDSLRPPSR